MPTGSLRVRKKATSDHPKPLDWHDLDQLDLPRDHFYRRFNELGRRECPRCGCDHIHIRHIQQYKTRGWEWRCDSCHQYWREPRAIPGAKTKLVAQETATETQPTPEVFTEKGCVRQEYPTETITLYK